MAPFNQHSHCACYKKGQGSDPCILKQDCHVCSVLTTDQVAQLATSSYKFKRTRKRPAPSFLVDPSSDLVLGHVSSDTANMTKST